MIKEGRVKLTEVGELNSKFVDQSLSVGEYFGERALITGRLLLMIKKLTH